MSKSLEPDECDREIKAIELRREGYTYEQIANMMNFSSRSTAWKIIKRGLERSVVESVDELRLLESQRLDALQYAIWDKCMAGDLKAINAAIRIMERRSKLFGLDAPSKVQAEIRPYEDSSVIDVELARLMRLLEEHPD